MTVVIDTNVLLQMRKQGNRCWPIMQAWAGGRFFWAVSNEIMFEYQEIVEQRTKADGWRKTTAVFDFVETIRPGCMRLISPTFRFHLITACEDDNKFADCAITAEADWIITEDRHFDALIGSGHKPQPIAPEEFISRILKV